MDSMAYRILSPEEQNQDMSSRFRFGLARSSFRVYQRSQMQPSSRIALRGGASSRCEVLFKAFAKAVDFACSHDPRIQDQIPSTKGKL